MNIYHTIPSNLNLDALTLYYMGLLKIMPIPQHAEEEKKVEEGKIIKKQSELLLPTLSPQQRKKFNAARYFTGTFLTKLSKIDYLKDFMIEIMASEMRSQYQDYDKVIDCLKKLSVVRVDESYLSQNYAIDPLDAHSKAYGLSKEYTLSFQNIPVDTKLFERRLRKIEGFDYRPDHSHTEEQVVRYQFETILKDCVFEEPDWQLWQTDSDTAELVKQGLERLRQGVLNLTSSAKVKRYHSVLTQMPKEGRQFIRYKGNDCFYGCDLVASHFTLICGILELDTEAIQRHISNDFYTSICDGRFPRDQIKSESYTYLYGSSYKREGQKWILKNRAIDKCMAKSLPDMHKRIHGMKKADKKLFSHQVMKLEADLVVTQCGGHLMDMGIPFFTVHDSIYTTKEHVYTVINLMTSVIKKAIGITPRIKTDLFL